MPISTRARTCALGGYVTGLGSAIAVTDVIAVIAVIAVTRLTQWSRNDGRDRRDRRRRRVPPHGLARVACTVAKGAVTPVTAENAGRPRCDCRDWP
jgi:hypothetical protein